MNNSVNLAISSAALVSSDAARRSVERLECKSIEFDFNKTTATVEQKQDYARCIDVLYPKMGGHEVFALKLIIVFCLIGSIIGFIKGNKEDIGDRFAYGAIGLVAGLLCLLFISAIAFLFMG